MSSALVTEPSERARPAAESTWEIVCGSQNNGTAKKRQYMNEIIEKIGRSLCSLLFHLK